MKLLNLIIAFSISASCYAQNNHELCASGKSLEEIIPINWKVLNYKIGDLNQDGLDDLVFAIQNTDKKTLKQLIKSIRSILIEILESWEFILETNMVITIKS